MNTNALISVASKLKDENTSTLKAVKLAFVDDYIQPKMKDAKIKDVIAHIAFDDDDLGFETFALELVGFAIFHEMVEKKKSETYLNAEAMERTFETCNTAARLAIAKYTKDFTQEIFNGLMLVVEALGHKSQIVELKAGNADEIMSQINELKGEEE